MASMILVPLDDTVVFPTMDVTLPVDVGDEDRVLLIPRHDNAFAKVGTIAEVTDRVRLPGGAHAVQLSGSSRGVAGAAQTDQLGRLRIEVTESIDTVPVDGRTRAIGEPGPLADTIGYAPDISFEEKVSVLETLDVTERLELAVRLQRERLTELQLRRKIREDVREGADKQQREYFLRKQMESIQRELGEDSASVVEEYRTKIAEYLAVKKLRVERGITEDKRSGAILTLIGPPGTGKTSIGESIARATRREFVRMSLGGVRDEAEIRGHRRTYIGALPGKIIQSMRKAKTSNPLFLLDEVDNMGSDFRGDPSSALLEVLDSEQNHTFNDHYLEVDYDLSSVMFITTANTLNIPPPLMDRMEIIRIAGYTEEEKVEIARKHLILNAVTKHGLKPKEWTIDEEALLTLIRRYTREAGVRNLEREISTLIRKAVKELTIEQTSTIAIDPKKLEAYLGVPKYRYGEVEADDLVGVVTGLAWTDVGGELLTIEGVMMPGKGRMTVTGNLRDVMKESISAAASYVRSRAVAFGIEPPMFDKRDIHVHVPEGATPKDGPSAGVAMVTAIISTMTGIPVRKDVAMTGEITLRGRILPIGGLKEKLLAAL